MTRSGWREQAECDILVKSRDERAGYTRGEQSPIGEIRSDEELMTALLLGDRSALATLVERYYDAMLAYLFRLCGGSRPLAEDLAQETFLALIDEGKASSYVPTRPLKPWLYAIATNRARDHFKSAAVRHASPREESEDALLDVLDAAPGPEELAIAADEGARIAAAIACLSEEQRAAVLLRFYHGFSLQEIADALRIPVGTVKSRLSLGARRLRELLSARPASPPSEGACR
jgi:RNA polymerase sigma-70 factor, ECF subfamily